MTRPKFRPCEFCQTPNQANRKTCHACYESLSTKEKLKKKLQSLDSQWGQTAVKNRNISRIFDSAIIAVRKLDAIGYKPILFYGRKEKGSNKWVADLLTHFEPTAHTKIFLEKMQRAYEYLLSKETSAPVQPHNSTEQQFVPSNEQYADKQPETLSEEQPETLSEEQPETLSEEKPETLSEEQPETLCEEQPETLSEENLQILSNKQKETLFILDLIPFSPPDFPCSRSLQKKKRQRKASPGASTTSPTDQVYLRPLSPPASHAISQSLSQSGLLENKKRKSYRQCSGQKVFKFETITGSRINAEKKEVKVQGLPCSVCGKIWDDTWEPASSFSQHFAIPGVPPP